MGKDDGGSGTPVCESIPSACLSKVEIVEKKNYIYF
jgi:hypothetical protein